MSLRKFVSENHGSAIGFIVGMLVLGLVVASLVGAFAYQISQAQTNTSVAGGATGKVDGTNFTSGGIPGGSAMLGILALLFIVIPVIVFARAAK